MNVLCNINKCLLFNSGADTEKTIFNYYLMEIAPILNEFYDRLIDVKLPKLLDEMFENDDLIFTEYPLIIDNNYGLFAVFNYFHPKNFLMQQNSNTYKIRIMTYPIILHE